MILEDINTPNPSWSAMKLSSVIDMIFISTLGYRFYTTEQVVQRNRPAVYKSLPFWRKITYGAKTEKGKKKKISNISTRSSIIIFGK